jgi:hypothetical protein
MCSPSGSVLGTLPPLDVVSPWWPDVEPVVAAAREQLGVDVTVLRVLKTTGRGPAGGKGAYLAQAGAPGDGTAADADSAAPWLRQLRPLTPDDELYRLAAADDPCRQAWARPGGVANDVAWADAWLDAAGTPRTGPAVQARSWNLSSVVRLPTAAGTFWCKRIPPFLAPEGPLLTALGSAEPGLVPHVVAHARDGDGSSVTLLRGADGVDQWEASEPVLTIMARRWVDVQARWASRVEELLALGLPDRRSAPLLAAVRTLVGRPEVRATLTGAELTALDAVVAALPARLAALDACGLPATLVHGDLHPGNWVGDGERLVLLDWGDSVVGHPMHDVPGFLARAPEHARPRLRAVIVDAWARHHPDADPDRALRLVEPVVALRAALVYRTFLDGIEATEQDYHADDVPAMLRLAVAASR